MRLFEKRAEEHENPRVACFANYSAAVHFNDSDEQGKKRKTLAQHREALSAVGFIVTRYGAHGEINIARPVVPPSA